MKKYAIKKGLLAEFKKNNAGNNVGKLKTWLWQA